MFGIDPTPFDVRLVAFGIPIRVHPSFWLGSIMFGSNIENSKLIFIWVVCSFVSILIHELGHALTAESFGWPSEIVMYFGGGLAMSQRARNDTPWRSIAVSAMGPIAGFMLLGLVFVIERVLGYSHHGILDFLAIARDRESVQFFLFSALQYLWFMNLYWGLLNLLPVLPLDGGFILESFFEAMRLRNPAGATAKVGAVVSGTAAYYFLARLHQPFVGSLMLLLFVQSLMAAQSRR